MKEVPWYEIPFLFDGYKKAIDEARQDVSFKWGSFEECFRGRIKKCVREWTWDEHERQILMQDMIDSAIDEGM